jgi:hypothetical protein
MSDIINFSNTANLIFSGTNKEYICGYKPIELKIMKKVLLLLFLFTLSVNAQKLKTVDSFDLSTSFEETKRLYKANFDVTKELILKDGSKISIGDTIKLGASSSKISNQYETIYIGRLTLAGALLGSSQELASTSFEQNTYVLDKVNVWRSLGKTGVNVELRDVYFKSGILGSAYLTASDYSVTRGELINPNALMTREQAISKLKESKDLLDLEMMTQKEYDKIKAELSPIIKGN